MPSTVQRRIVSLIAAFAFLATAGADAYGLHSCPHHDGVPASQHAHASNDAVAGHPGSDHLAGKAAAPGHGTAMGGAHEGAGNHPADSHADHGPCTCVGACSATAVSVPSEPARVLVAAPPVGTVAAVPGDAQTLPGIRAYILPWANAPPIR